MLDGSKHIDGVYGAVAESIVLPLAVIGATRRRLASFEASTRYHEALDSTVAALEVVIVHLGL